MRDLISGISQLCQNVGNTFEAQMTTHPEFPQEQAFLAKTVDAIDTALQRQNDLYFESGANNYTNRVLNTGLREDILKQLREFGHEPYFARLEFVSERGRQQVYFGHAHLGLSHGTILDWRCDLYSLYLGGNARQQTYRVQATGKIHKVDLLLKRRLEIKDNTLHDMADTVDYRNQPQVAPVKSQQVQEKQSAPRETDTASDEFLIRRLNERGDPRLQDIVATIQADQDAIIRAPMDQALLLHGVAGSGKTSIAYHRLAYLMFTEHGYKLQPKDILVIGPNRMFLGYVSDLLPSLGVGGIQQQTFADWTWAQLRKRDTNLPQTVQFVDPVEEALNSPRQNRAEQDRLWLSARVRGSLKFRQVLERHVQRLAEQPPLGTAEFRNAVKLPMSDTVPGSAEYVLNPAALRELWQQTDLSAPLAQRREQLVQKAHEHMGHFMEKNFGHAEEAELLRELRRLRTNLSNFFNQTWKVSLLESFEALFQTGWLSSVAKGLLTNDEVRALRQTRPAPLPKRTEKGKKKEAAAPQSIDVSDLPGLLVLSELLYGSVTTTYRHLVLDEAQDFSPLQLDLLLRACPSQSVTIVGDTAQSIFAYRGIEQWDEFTPLLPEDKLQNHLIRQNYRSTAPIVALCNAVQRALLGDKALESLAIQRQGAKPLMVALASAEQQQLHVLGQLRELLGAGHPTVSVIMARPQEVAEFSSFLKRQGMEHIALLEDQPLTTASLRGVIVTTASLSKGLEFAAVIVPNADEEHYSSSSKHDGHLLYVALSRALHVLRLTTVERFTGWLDAAQQKAELDYSRLKRPPIVWSGQTLRMELAKSRLGGVAFEDIAEEIALRVEALLREKRFDEVLEGYGHYGQLSRHTLNDVLQMLSQHNTEKFVHRALDFYLPEALRAQVEAGLKTLTEQNCPNLALYRQKYQALMGITTAPTPQSVAVKNTAQPRAAQPVRGKPPFSASGLDATSLRKSLGRKVFNIRKPLRVAYLRCQEQLLPHVPVEIRELVRGSIRYNLFNELTATAAQTAFRQLGLKEPVH